MKRLFTLITLAVLLVTASSFAQGQLQGRPLSKQHVEQLAKVAGKDMKVKPSLKAQQMQKSMDIQKGLRQSVTAHNLLTKKPLVKKHSATSRRASAAVIDETPEGKQVFYERSGEAYYVTFGYVFQTTLYGAIGNVVFGDNNKVYIQNLVSQAGANTWTVGTINGSTITIQLPQTAIAYEEYGYNLEVAKVKSSGNTYVKDNNQTLVLNYDATTGNISMKSGDTVGLVYDDDDSWSGYADWNASFKTVTDPLVEAPANLQTEVYSLSADGFSGTLVNVGFDGNDVYVQGVDPNLPENWIKGTIDGNKATFKNGQYIGADLIAGYHQYLVSATAKEAYDEYYEEYYTEYELNDADITFDFDSNKKTLSNGSTFLINAGKEEVAYAFTLDKAKMEPFTEVAATPANPEIIELYEGGINYYLSGYGWGYIAADINTKDVDGNYIMPEKLSYAIWVKVNGEEKQLSLSWDDYASQEVEKMDELPFGYKDNWDIYADGTTHTAYYYVIGPEAYGVQAIYRGAGEERRSEIVWAEVTELGADVQPAAATPAYPEVTIGENDNRINYGFFTGEENINSASNNYKTETYDVAIKLSEPALVGTAIESITFPLQEIEGVSDIKAFVTSQLRVENGKNTPDLAVKDITPTEAGFITVKLEKPYQIPEGGVYVGYSFTINDAESELNAAPVAITDQMNDDGFYLHTSDGFLKWLNVSDIYNGSSMITVTVGGSNLKSDAASLEGNDTKYVKSGEAFELPLTIVNHGAKGIQSIDVEYSVNGNNGTQHIATTVIPFFGKKNTVTLNVPAIAERGNYTLTAKVAKVNGVANEDANSSATTDLIVLNTVPKHRVLLEEYTGFWCGYCPRGYVALEKLAELYPDDYVLVSYHNGDELEILDSSKFPSAVEGFPDAWMERSVELDAYYGSGNNEFGIVNDLEEQSKEFGIADIKVTPTLNATGTTVSVKTEVTFPFDVENGKYALEYILVHDGLSDKSWGQSNYYSDGAQGYPKFMDDFTLTSEGTVFGLTFNDVAVKTSTIGGIRNSIPATVQADAPVAHNYSFQLSAVKNTSNQSIIQDKSKLKVVALLINTATGEVVNANKANVTNPSGIADMSADLKNAQVTYYDLSGRKVAKPANGMFIKTVRTNGGQTISEKVLVK